uniref:chorismate-binding protein n=1 Tax=Prevotella sp. TaxID=59823 RepID=UPI0025E4999D
KKGFDAIKDEIARGNTYEVNYTFDFSIDTEYRADEIYKYFLQIQKTPYNAFLSNDYETILSFSPELFFRKNGRRSARSLFY